MLFLILAAVFMFNIPAISTNFGVIDKIKFFWFVFFSWSSFLSIKFSHVYSKGIFALFWDFLLNGDWSPVSRLFNVLAAFPGDMLYGVYKEVAFSSFAKFFFTPTVSFIFSVFGISIVPLLGNTLGLFPTVIVWSFYYSFWLIMSFSFSSSKELSSSVVSSFDPIESVYYEKVT